jgi:hypothetical protein
MEQQGEADIPAENVKGADTSLIGTVTVPTDKKGSWDIVVNDGVNAVTIAKIDVVAATQTQATDAPKPDEPAPNDETISLLAAEDSSVATAGRSLLAGLSMPASIPTTINTAFLGHGMFLEYAPITTLRRYANYKGADPNGATTTQLVQRFIQAMQDMRVGSVWIQLFTALGQLDNGSGGTTELVAGLKAANISFAGWGYCYSGNAAKDSDLAKKLCGQYDIKAFVADVEPGNPVHGSPDTWKPAAFNNLIAGLKANFGVDNMGISTFGTLVGHQDAAAIYKLAVNDVSFFAPQVYWYQKPPVAYMKQCIASFRQSGIGSPLVGTGQAYWEVVKGGGVSRGVMETQVKNFVSGFDDWSELIGLNWYHGGNANTDTSGSMSDAMISAIAAGGLDQKPYAAPAAEAA